MSNILKRSKFNEITTSVELGWTTFFKTGLPKKFYDELFKRYKKHEKAIMKVIKKPDTGIRTEHMPSHSIVHSHRRTYQTKLKLSDKQHAKHKTPRTAEVS